MINKEKLLKEIKLKSDDVDVTWVCSFIKNFPEEPEIDFDALYGEYNDLKTVYDKKPTPHGFRDFLKSKNLTVPKPFEIPVKKTWMLKKEFTEFCKEFIPADCDDVNIIYMRDSVETYREKYYDQHEQPDYSKIPNGSIVEVEFVGGNGNNCGYVNGITNKSISIGFHMLYNSGNSTTINFDQIKSIVILKLAKERV